MRTICGGSSSSTRTRRAPCVPSWVAQCCCWCWRCTFCCARRRPRSSRRAARTSMQRRTYRALARLLCSRCSRCSGTSISCFRAPAARFSCSAFAGGPGSRCSILSRPRTSRRARLEVPRPCARVGRTCVVLSGASGDCLPLYLDAGLRLFKLGEQAVVQLVRLLVERHESQRASTRVNRGIAMVWRSRHPARRGAQALLPDLRRVSAAWLAQPARGRERFSLGLQRRLCGASGVGRSTKRIALVAFATLLTTARRRMRPSISCATHRRHRRARWTFCSLSLMLHFQAEGYRRFDLGMAPLSGMAEHRLRRSGTGAAQAAVRARRELLQLPRAAQVQGEIRPAVGASLSGLAGRHDAVHRHDGRRSNDRRQPEGGVPEVKTGAVRVGQPTPFRTRQRLVLGG